MQDLTADSMTGLKSKGQQDCNTPTRGMPGRPGHTPRMRNTTTGGFIGQGWDAMAIQQSMTDNMSDQDSDQDPEAPEDYDTPTCGISDPDGETLQTHNTTPGSFVRQGHQTPLMHQGTTSRGMSGQGVETPTVHNTTTGGRNAQDQHAQSNFKTPTRVKVGRDERLPPNLLRGHGIRQSAHIPQVSLQTSAPSGSRGSSGSDVRRPSFPMNFNAQSYRENQALPPATPGNMSISKSQFQNAFSDPFENSEMATTAEQDLMLAQNARNMHHGMPQEQQSMMLNNAQNMHRGIPPHVMMRPNMNSNVFRGQDEMAEDGIDEDSSVVSPTNTYSTVDISDQGLPHTPASNRKYLMFNNAHDNAFFHQPQKPETPTPMKMSGSTEHSSNTHPLMMFSGNNNMRHGNMRPGVPMGQSFNPWDPRFFSPNDTFNMEYPPSNMAMNNPQNMGRNPGMANWQLAANSQMQGFNFPMSDQQRYAVDQHLAAAQRPTSAQQHDLSKQGSESANPIQHSQQIIGPGTRYTGFQQPASGHHAILRSRGHTESTTEEEPGDTDAAPARLTLLSAEERQRQREQRILAEGKEAGKTYKQIQALIGTNIAESTLRGRWRMMSKAKCDRLRKPVWMNEDVSCALLSLTYDVLTFHRFAYFKRTSLSR